MFVGEFFCVLPLLWAWLSNPAKGGRQNYLSRLLARTPTPEGYEPVPAEPAPVAEEEEEEDSDSETELRVGRPLRGWAVFWMWFPAFFDSESRVVGGVPGSLAHTHRDKVIFVRALTPTPPQSAARPS